MIFVGIDWSTRYHDVCILNERGEKIKEFRIQIGRPDFAELIAVLSEFGEPVQIHVGIEDGNNILVDFLMAAGYTVFALNPKRVSRFKERYSASAKKDDRFDAFNIALILLKDRDGFTPLVRSSDACEEMKIHCETIENLVRARTRLMNQLWAELSLYFPAFLGFFKDMNSNVMLRVLKLIANPKVFENFSEEEFATLLADVGYMSVNRKRELYAHLSAHTVHISSPGIAARAIRAEILGDQILAINASIKGVEELVEELFEQHSQSAIFQSLPGAGERLAPRLLALIGDNKERFDSYQRLQSYAGTCPVTEQSGKWLHRVNMRRACNKGFRHALHLFSFTSMRSEKWAREYYDLMKSRGKSHNAAIRALANKWAKIIYRMWKENQPYDREKFLKNRVICAPA